VNRKELAAGWRVKNFMEGTGELNVNMGLFLIKKIT
jgi:hypothetical protein